MQGVPCVAWGNREFKIMDRGTLLRGFERLLFQRMWRRLHGLAASGRTVNIPAVLMSRMPAAYTIARLRLLRTAPCLLAFICQATAEEYSGSGVLDYKVFSPTNADKTIYNARFKFNFFVSNGFWQIRSEKLFPKEAVSYVLAQYDGKDIFVKTHFDDQAFHNAVGKLKPSDRGIGENSTNEAGQVLPGDFPRRGSDGIFEFGWRTVPPTISRMLTGIICGCFHRIPNRPCIWSIIPFRPAHRIWTQRCICPATAFNTATAPSEILRSATSSRESLAERNPSSTRAVIPMASLKPNTQPRR